MRLFVAIDPPAAIREALGRWAEPLREDGLRPVPVDQLHLTLRFLGEVPEAQVPALADRLAAAAAGPSFRLSVVGGGAFPGAARPRVLWAGLAGDLEALQALARRIDEAVTACGLPPADHPFRAHLTLARAKGRRVGRAAVERVRAIPDLGAFTVDEVLLVKSTLGARAVHERLRGFPLG